MRLRSRSTEEARAQTEAFSSFAGGLRSAAPAKARQEGKFEVFKLLHVSLVVAANLLDADVVLGLYVGLGGGVGPGQGHHADDVLEVLLVFNFDLWGRITFISERLIDEFCGADAGSGSSGRHRNFTLAGRWDNEEGLGGNIATGGSVYLTHPPITTTDERL